MAQTRTFVTLTANQAKTVTLDRNFSELEIVNLTDISAVIYGTDTGTATIDGDDHFVIVGGLGAFSDNIKTKSNNKQISLIATVDCKVYVGRLA